MFHVYKTNNMFLPSSEHSMSSIWLVGKHCIDAGWVCVNFINIYKIGKFFVRKTMQFPSTCLIDFYLFQFLTNSDNGDGRVEEKKNINFLFCYEVVVLCGLILFLFCFFFIFFLLGLW